MRTSRILSICLAAGVLVTCGNGESHRRSPRRVTTTVAKLAAPDRPGCFVEPSNTAAGFEVIFYSHISGRADIGDPLGFEVRCPMGGPR